MYVLVVCFVHPCMPNAQMMYYVRGYLQSLILSITFCACKTHFGGKKYPSCNPASCSIIISTYVHIPQKNMCFIDVSIVFELFCIPVD